MDALQNLLIKSFGFCWQWRNCHRMVVSALALFVCACTNLPSEQNAQTGAHQVRNAYSSSKFFEPSGSKIRIPRVTWPRLKRPSAFGNRAQSERVLADTVAPASPALNAGTELPGLASRVTTLSDLETQLRVTLDVKELPLSQLLSLLADKAGTDLVVNGIEDTPVTLKLVDRSLAETLDLLCEQVAAAWQFREGAVYLFEDRSFVSNYSVNYLNMARNTSSSLGLATQVGSITLDAESSSSSGHSNNSDTQIDNISNHDVWATLTSNLESLLEAVGNRDERLIVNREAGLVTVVASQRLQKVIRRYLNTIESSLNRQVLIEATVIEVNLNDEHRKGVDWSLFAGDDEGTSDSFGGTGLSWSQRFHGQSFPDSINGAQSLPSSLLRIGGSRSGIGSLSATVDLLDQFGDVRILSRPQIIAMNNQSAVLKVVDNRVYFSVEIERSTRNDELEVSTQTRIHTVPIGLVMNVIPFITEDQRVVLNVRPSISRILGFAEDPNPELSLGGVQNSVPEIQVREMESVLSVASGETVVIGGLMQELSSYNDRGVPGFSDLPVLGKLFGKLSSSRTKSELLVFLKPTILPTTAGRGRYVDPRLY